MYWLFLLRHTYNIKLLYAWNLSKINRLYLCHLVSPCFRLVAILHCFRHILSLQKPPLSTSPTTYSDGIMINVYRITFRKKWYINASEYDINFIENVCCMYSTLQVYQRSYSQVRHIPPKMSDKFESRHSLSPSIWSDILVGRESGY